MNPISQLLIVLIAFGITSARPSNGRRQGPNPIERLRLMWSHTDVDNDGFMSKPELRLIYTTFDKNGDNIVNEAEMIQGWQERNPNLPAAAVAVRAKGLFRVGDMNRDGSITAEDLDVLYARFDEDGNQTVTREEFFAYWQWIFGEMKKAAMAKRQRNGQ